MRLFFYFFFATTATLVAMLPEEDLFSFDMSSADDSPSWFLDDDTNDDLYYPTDFSTGYSTDYSTDSSTNPTDFFSSVEVHSCLSQDEQDLFSKLRLRNEICGTSNDQPLPSNLSDEKEGMQKDTITKTYMGLYCLPDFPVHLCCEEEGEPISSTSFIGYIFESMHKCQYGMLICVCF